MHECMYVCMYVCMHACMYVSCHHVRMRAFACIYPLCCLLRLLPHEFHVLLGPFASSFHLVSFLPHHLLRCHPIALPTVVMCGMMYLYVRVCMCAYAYKCMAQARPHTHLQTFLVHRRCDVDRKRATESECGVKIASEMSKSTVHITANASHMALQISQ